MAGEFSVTGFRLEDRLLRRVRFKDHMKRGILFWRAFKEKDPTLSFTLQDQSLLSDKAVDDYQAYFARQLGGDLPGIVWLTVEGLAVRLDPPLPPRRDPDNETDPVYGHLHCVTDAPRDKEQMERMAMLVNSGQWGGVLREVVVKSGS